MQRDLAGRRDGAGWLSPPTWHMPQAWSEPPQRNAYSIHMCMEARQWLCQHEMQGWGERKRQRRSHSPQNKINMTQPYQLMTRGGSWKMSTFLSHFLENTQPRTHSLMENYCSRSHNTAKTRAVRRAGETGCDALQRGHGAGWYQTQTRCTAATHLPAWLSKCPLSPAVGASSPRSSQLLCSGTLSCTSTSLAAASHPPSSDACL